MAGMYDIELATQRYADARSAVESVVSAIEDEMAAVKKRHMARLKKAVASMAMFRDELTLDIRDNVDLFTKRRTQIFYGVKVGLQKQKGEITWADEAQVLKLIHKHFPDMAESLIKFTEKPLKSGLAQLAVADLKKLGVAVENDTDVVVIKDTVSEVEKLVVALLKDEEIKEAA